MRVRAWWELGSDIEQVAGSPYGRDALLVIDGVPYLLEDSDLRDVSWSLPVPVEQLESHGEDTWMLGSGRLFVLADGSVTEPEYRRCGPHLWLRGVR